MTVTMHERGVVRRDIDFEDAHILIFERQMMVRLSGDLDFGAGLGKQGDSEKENGETAYASHEARF